MGSQDEGHLRGAVGGDSETRAEGASSQQGAAPAPALVAEIEAYSSTGTSGRGKSSRSGGDDKDDEEEEEEAEQEEEDEDENSGTQAKGKRCTIRTVTEVHRAVPPAKNARTEKRRKKVKMYQNLIDAGITGQKFKRWCQYAFRGTGAKKRRATVDEVLKTWGLPEGVRQLVEAMIDHAPHEQQGFPNTGKPNQQRALLEECFWHWGEKFPLDQNCLDLLGGFLDDIIKQLPTLTYQRLDERPRELSPMLPQVHVQDAGVHRCVRGFSRWSSCLDR